MTNPRALSGDPLPTDLRSGIHRLESRRPTASIRSELEAAGWAATIVDLRAASEKGTILAAFAHGLAFPGWVGRNWDALDDALRDLSWWPPGPRGRLIIVRGAERSTVGTTADRQNVREILETAVARWARTDVPLVDPAALLNQAARRRWQSRPQRGRRILSRTS